MKRLDLIFSERELDSILKSLEEAGASGYSVMKNVTGKGPNSEVTEDMEFTGLGANAHVIVFCEEMVLEKLRSSLPPILNYYGGVAYVAETSSL